MLATAAAEWPCGHELIGTNGAAHDAVSSRRHLTESA
jgi:hypothetical protein